MSSAKTFMSYRDIIKSFRPTFGNANHIAAARLIAEISRLEASLEGLVPRSKRVAPLNRELEELKARVLALISPNAPLSTYPPSFPQHEANTRHSSNASR
jgi:hypothetical protein